MEVKDIKNIQIACDLIESGLRLPLVNSLSGIESRRMLRGLWKEIYGEKPNPGQLPDSVIRYIKDYQSAAELAGFVALYRSIQESQGQFASYDGVRNFNLVLNPLTLLESWKEFKKLTGTCIDINAGYYVVRDIIFEIVLYATCKSCSASFIFDPSKRHTERCPFCRTLYITDH